MAFKICCTNQWTFEWTKRIIQRNCFTNSAIHWFNRIRIECDIRENRITLRNSFSNIVILVVSTSVCCAILPCVVYGLPLCALNSALKQRMLAFNDFRVEWLRSKCKINPSKWAEFVRAKCEQINKQLEEYRTLSLLPTKPNRVQHFADKIIFPYRCVPQVLAYWKWKVNEKIKLKKHDKSFLASSSKSVIVCVWTVCVSV